MDPPCTFTVVCSEMADPTAQHARSCAYCVFYMCIHDMDMGEGHSEEIGHIRGVNGYLEVGDTPRVKREECARILMMSTFMGRLLKNASKWHSSLTMPTVFERNNWPDDTTIRRDHQYDQCPAKDGRYEQDILGPTSWAC